MLFGGQFVRCPRNDSSTAMQQLSEHSDTELQHPETHNRQGRPLYAIQSHLKWNYATCAPTLRVEKSKPPFMIRQIYKGRIAKRASNTDFGI